MSNVTLLRNTGGFTRMDNELYEALIRAELSGREMRVALAIHRLTAGYNVEEARIAASVIAEMSGINREDVSRAISELIRQRVIYRVGGSRSPMGFAPSTEWQIDRKNTHPNKKKEVPQCGVSNTSNVAFLPHNKDSKDNLDPSGLVAATAPTTVEVVEAQGEQPALIPDQPASQPERIPFQKIADLYNRICGQSLPQCLKLSEDRKRNIRKCWNLKFNGGFPFRKGEFWEGYFNDCLTNRHWLGENDREWRADIEFLTREKTVLKVLEAL
ncbi:replication protein [Pseudomonas nitroreducens]|uniref:replication protein n=1 Tax=Pseudomonas nitroreducens TaxID=46680 RepID=UPI0028ADC05E|nr:replication protein [Pseudomonas nitroreducens]